jgi:hypothetical protein
METSSSASFSLERNAAALIILKNLDGIIEVCYK